jgi:adenosylhomocysteine nucleosidase
VTPILILTAVELEARKLARELELPLLRAFSFPAFGRGALRLAPVGLRAVLCGPRWARLLDGLDHPLVVSAGVCGGLDPRLRPGDLVIPERVMEPPGDPHPIASDHHRAALARGGATAWTGPLITTREVVRTPEAKAALFAASGAVAADMESAVIVARAAGAGCPALVVRGVSDGAGESLAPELTGLVTREGRLRLGRALALTVTRPATLSEALGLRRRTYQALGAVARVLAALTG